MRRFAVVGNPIAHSKSPVIHAGFAEQCGHQIDYQKILVEPGEFDAVVTAFFEQGGAGLNVTAPFKEEAFNVAAVRTEAAEDAKAANTLSSSSARLKALSSPTVASSAASPPLAAPPPPPATASAARASSACTAGPRPG